MGHSKSDRIKGLEKQIEKRTGKLQTALQNKARIQAQIREEKKKIEELEALVDSLRGGEITVSDHAIVRYFERVLGFDIEEIKSQILTPEILKCCETLGGSGQYTTNGVKVILNNNKVVTVVNLNTQKK